MAGKELRRASILLLLSRIFSVSGEVLRDASPSSIQDDVATPRQHSVSLREGDSHKHFGASDFARIHRSNGDVAPPQLRRLKVAYDDTDLTEIVNGRTLNTEGDQLQTGENDSSGEAGSPGLDENTEEAIVRHEAPPQEVDVLSDSIYGPRTQESDNVFAARQHDRN